MPSICHSGSSYNAQHLSLRLVLQCPASVTQARPTMPSICHSGLSYNAQHLSLRLVLQCPASVTQARPTIPSICHSGSSYNAQHLSLRLILQCPASVTQARPTMPSICHSGSSYNAQHLSLRLVLQCPASVTQARPTMPSICHSGSSYNAQHLSLRLVLQCPASVTQARPTMPSNDRHLPLVSAQLHYHVHVQLHLERLADRPSLVTEKIPSWVSCHLLRYVSTVLSPLRRGNVLWVGSLRRSLCNGDDEGVSTLPSGCITGIMTGTLSLNPKRRKYNNHHLGALASFPGHAVWERGYRSP